MPMIPDDLDVFRKYKETNKPQFGPPDCSHPQETQESGFGLAGGGYGPYTYCNVCYRIIWKHRMADNEE